MVAKTEQNPHLICGFHIWHIAGAIFFIFLSVMLLLSNHPVVEAQSNISSKITVNANGTGWGGEDYNNVSSNSGGGGTSTNSSDPAQQALADTTTGLQNLMGLVTALVVVFALLTIPMVFFARMLR